MDLLITYVGGPLRSLLACTDLELPSLRRLVCIYRKKSARATLLGEGGDPLPRQGPCGLGDPAFSILGDRCLVGTSLWTMSCGTQP